VRLQGLGKLKKIIYLTGLESATFRLVAYILEAPNNEDNVLPRNVCRRDWFLQACIFAKGVKILSTETKIWSCMHSWTVVSDSLALLNIGSSFLFLPDILKEVSKLRPSFQTCQFRELNPLHTQTHTHTHTRAESGRFCRMRDSYTVICNHARTDHFGSSSTYSDLYSGGPRCVSRTGHYYSAIYSLWSRFQITYSHFD
jgi:hypothetical protein